MQINVGKTGAIQGFSQKVHDRNFDGTPRIFLNFIFPILMIISIAIGTYIAFSSAKTMESFLLVVIFMTVSMMISSGTVLWKPYVPGSCGG